MGACYLLTPWRANISKISLRTTFLGNGFGSYELLTAETELPGSGSAYQHLSASQVNNFNPYPNPGHRK